MIPISDPMEATSNGSQNPEVAMHTVASASGGNNVSALVAKSKKAASSLFTLLHAKVRHPIWFCHNVRPCPSDYICTQIIPVQNCKLGVHRCLHPGCAEAKLIYLHLKTCSCSTLDVEPCPTSHKGCADARKLLNHYRRCREIRSRQVASRSRDPQHVCLLCSLVARNAIGFADRNRSTSPMQHRSKSHRIPSLSLSSDMKTSIELHSRVRPRSTSPHRDVQLATSDSFRPQKWQPEPLDSPRRMPPPPPKFLSSKYNVSVTFDVDPVDDLRGTNNGDWRQRPRAESLDIRFSQPHRPDNDTALSFLDERSEESEVAAPPTQHRRRRSASCSILSPQRNVESGPTFDPILEEPVGHELQQILEGDP